MKNSNYDVTTGEPAELSPLQKMYLELKEIIEPRLLDDFCGYNEETQGFDLLLATKQIIQAKEQECKNLKEKNQYLINTCCHLENEIKKHKKAVHKYKVVLQDKIEHLHLSRREFLKEINSIPVRIACKGESFKNALNNFNNAISVINNEDNYKYTLKEIEESVSKHCISADDYNKIRNNKWVYAFSKGYATARWELINPILGIINKAKGGE